MPTNIGWMWGALYLVVLFILWGILESLLPAEIPGLVKFLAVVGLSFLATQWIYPRLLKFFRK